MNSAGRPRAWRRLLSLLWVATWVAACLGTGCKRAQACEPQPLNQVAPGVWAWAGQDQELSASNQGHITTQVVLQSGTGTWVIDPGPTEAHGQALRVTIACQLNTPIAGVWNSHAHAENTLGNQAFLRSGSAIWATPETQAAMRERCPSCLAHLLETVGPAAIGTSIAIPERVATLSAKVWQAAPDGPSGWQLRAFKAAHSESDTVWWRAQDRVLIAAGLVYQKRLPELAQGGLRAWVAALDALWALKPRVVIGQMVGNAEDLVNTRRYLCALQDAVLEALGRGETASSVSSLPLPEFSDWAGYASRQGFNTQRAWREIESAWMQGSVQPCAALGDAPN